MKKAFRNFVPWPYVAIAFAVTLLIAGIVSAATLPQGSAVFETSLQSRISSTDTSMTLVSTSTASGEVLPSGYHCFTLDEGRTDAEYVCGTLTSSKTVTGLTRGLSYLTGTTSVSANQHAHRVGADVKLTDYPLLQILRNQANGSDTFPNLLSYTSGTDCSAGHASNVLCSGTYEENYANNVIAGGAPTSTESYGGKVELGTIAEQASSFDGGVNKPTVLQTKNSTSTCQVVGSYNIVASTTTGKLDKGCFDQTANYTLTGTTTLTSQLTASATTSIKANSVQASPLILNGVSYALPATQGASSTALETDGNGSLSWAQQQLRVLYLASSEDSTNSNSSTTIRTVALPANTLTTSKEIEGRFVFTSQGSVIPICDFELRYGTGAATTTIATLQASNAASFSYLDFTMIATSTTNQRFAGTAIYDAAGDSAVLTQSSASTFRLLWRNTNVTLTSASYFDVIAKLSSGTGSCYLSGASLKVLSPN